jgi:hypothetical protein
MDLRPYMDLLEDTDVRRGHGSEAVHRFVRRYRFEAVHRFVGRDRFEERTQI